MIAATKVQAQDVPPERLHQIGGKVAQDVVVTGMALITAGGIKAAAPHVSALLAQIKSCGQGFDAAGGLVFSNGQLALWDMGQFGLTSGDMIIDDQDRPDAHTCVDHSIGLTLAGARRPISLEIYSLGQDDTHKLGSHPDVLFKRKTA
ncbi:hypothetical protein [uncultured Tateyamaria sp.]|uniref:hypothetical protein n=1 Tax=uncultured Tateyamaria sp. TaxID=455651 RepID=UPI0026030D4F|nr:hypothetical protein [uncultured Tateyamaria sp.]